MPGEALELTPNAATLEQLRSTARAVARLWRKLAIAPHAFPPAHEEHSLQVALFALRIARFMGLGDEQAARILRAAYLHDVGGVSVPREVMRKRGAFTAEERKSMQVHPRVSCELLGAFLPTLDLAAITLSHHERFDGQGYPEGLEGVRIPLEARVLAIADSLDAMISRRPYRDPLPFSAALDEVRREAGRQFDPTIVEVLSRKGNALSAIQNDATL